MRDIEILGPCRPWFNPGGGSMALLLALGVLTQSAGAFSLLGPYDTWMVPQLGFAQPEDIGGPMALGEEYRWNTPVLTYAFDQSFLDYFGSNGVAAVENAIGVLNSLPPASQLDVTNFPAETRRLNYVAESESLRDLKSQTFALLLEQLGLASPTRFTFCVRNLAFVNGQPQATVIQRNYAPSSLTPSSQVDDVNYTYQLVYSGTPPTNVDAVELLVDPTQKQFPAVADGAMAAGECYTGLTADDAGGLKYLLNTNNINFEPLLADVSGAGSNAASFVDQALRGGVDRISFVRVNLDPLLGGLFAPFTNQYLDAYITNGTIVHQQVERVVTQPDILFSAADLSTTGTPVPAFVRTGTTNWLSSAAPGAAGPGIIRPGVRITFNRTTSFLQTGESAGGGGVVVEDFLDFRWGSFDQTTNTPVAYPENAGAALTNGLTVQLELDSAERSAQFFAWQLPVAMGNQATIESSTDLVTWTPVCSITNHGVAWKWKHWMSQPQRYFRVVPH